MYWEMWIYNQKTGDREALDPVSIDTACWQSCGRQTSTWTAEQLPMSVSHLSAVTCVNRTVLQDKWTV